jgi:chromosome segregation ATPase
MPHSLRSFPVYVFFILALSLTGCQQAELEKLRRDSVLQKQSLDSLRTEYERVAAFKTQVVRDFGESASRLEERLKEISSLKSQSDSLKQVIKTQSTRIDTLLKFIADKEKPPTKKSTRRK